MLKFFITGCFITLNVFILTGFSQTPAFRKEINFTDYPGLIEQCNQIGPNRILMTFKDYVLICDTSHNIIHSIQGAGLPNTGNPKLGTVKVKDGILLAYTDPSYHNIWLYKFSDDLSTLLYTRDYNFGTYGVQPTFDLNFFVQDSTTKNATFIGGHSNCSQAIIVKLDSALNVLSSTTIVNFENSNPKNFVDKSIRNNSVYLLHKENIAHSYVVKTNLSGAVESGFNLAVGDSATHGSRILSTTDGNLLISGRTYYLGDPTAVQFLLKCDTLGNTLWCKTYISPMDKGIWAQCLTEVNNQYYLSGAIGYDFTTQYGVTMQINPLNGALTAYKIIEDPIYHWTMAISGIAKVNNKCLVTVNYSAVPNYFYATTPMDIESCLEYSESINDSNLIPTTSTIPFSSLYSGNMPVWGGSTFPISILPITKSILTPCSTPTSSNQELTNEPNTSVSVFPNPAQHAITIRINEPITRVQLLNTLGKTISTTLAQNSTEVLVTFPDNMPQGVYILQVFTHTGIQTKTIVKQ